MKIYYHNLNTKGEELIDGILNIRMHSTQNSVPLVMYVPDDIRELTAFWGFRRNEKTVYVQFLQASIPDDNNGYHHFLALKDFEGNIIKESLWTTKMIIEKILETLNKQ